MNLLILTNNLRRASFRQRVGMYLDRLRAAGLTRDVVELPKGFWARRKVFKKARGYDGVLLQKKRLNYSDAGRLRRYARKIIYDFDDAVMYSDRNPERYSRSHFVPFRRTVRLADVVIAGNAYLAEHAGRFNSNVEILPTGLDTRPYKSIEASKTDGKVRLVWIGSKSTLGYLAGIKPALEDIGSRFDNVVLRIICDEFFDLQNMQVEKHPWSEQTQAVDLVTSDIGLAPLPDNPFTRGKCGFKILQYAAAGLPVIASPVGVNADYVRQELTGFLATSTDEWISAMTALIKNGQLRREMGDRNVEEAKRFDIDLIGRQFVDLIMECLKGAR